MSLRINRNGEWVGSTGGIKLEVLAEKSKAVNGTKRVSKSTQMVTSKVVVTDPNEDYYKAVRRSLNALNNQGQPLSLKKVIQDVVFLFGVWNITKEADTTIIEKVYNELAIT